MTWGQAAAHTLPQALDLLGYWRDHPPAHICLAIIGRIAPPKKETVVDAESDDGFRKFMAAWRGKGGAVTS